MEKAYKLKEEGTKEFLSGNHISAAELYKRAADLVSSKTDMYVKCCCNAAMCHVKEKSWCDVIYCCNKVLDASPDEANTNIKVKLLYRRGLARMHVGELKDAKADLMAAFALDNFSKDVRKAIKELKVKIAKAKKKEKPQFGGIFGKVSMYDDKSFNLLLVSNAKGGELVGFPDTVLAIVAEFLTKTERALAAVAMTAPASSWRKSNWQMEPSEASKVMVDAKPMEEIKVNYSTPEWQKQSARKKSYNWDFVDFEDIGKYLAAKLTDDDIGGVLVCIDAVSTIKKLKLKGCVTITGHGLEPLRGSVVLEQLDLSLVGSGGTWGESPILFPAPYISDEAVIPILDSIIDAEGSVLKHLRLPKKWRGAQSTLLSRCLANYNRVLNNREIVCSYNCRYGDSPCGSTCDSDETPWVPLSGEFYGIMQFTCYDCNENFCEEHREWMTPGVCEICEKVCCSDCHKTAMCDSCFKITCWNCTRVGFCGICELDLCADCTQVFWCDGCDESCCEDCSPFLICNHDDCHKMNCAACTAGDDDRDDWGVKECSTCQVSFCVDHLIVEISNRGEGAFCEECHERAILAIVQKNKSILHYLHVWEELYRYEERFESDLKSKNISKLLREQERMKQRWDHLYSKSTAEQRRTTVCIEKMFIV